MKNIVDFGAVGDGLTDDGPAILAACMAAGDLETVFVPKSTAGFWTAQTIDLGGKPITLRGEGQSKAQNVYGGGGYIFGNVEGPIIRSLYPAQGCTIVDVGFCNRHPAGVALELSGNQVTVDRVSMHAWKGIRFANSTFSAAVRSAHIRWSGFTPGSVGISIGGHVLVHGCDVIGFDRGITACGLGVDIRSLRIERCRTGILLGVDQNGNNLQITGGVVDALSLEANDTAVECRAACLTSMRGIVIQGTPNAPAGASQHGFLVSIGQGLEVAASISNGAFAVASVKIAASNSGQRWSNVLTSNTNPAGKRWDIASMKNLVIEQCD